MAQQPKQNRLGRSVAISLTLLLALLAVWALVQHAGAKRPLSAELPAERMNRVYGAIDANAANLYGELLQRLPADEMQRIADTTWRSVDQLPPDVAAWVDDHEEFAELARLATACERCYFKLEDLGGGNFRATSIAQWRRLALYFICRARRADERRDLARYAESLQMLDRLGRHARQQPSAIAQVFCNVFRIEAQQKLLAPLAWPELSPAEREWYLALAEELCTESPLTIQPFRDEAELSAAALRNGLGASRRMLVSSARLNGEIQKQLDPLEALLDQPIEQRLTPGNPLRMALAAPAGRRSVLRYIFNLPGAIADSAAYSVDSFVTADARLVTLLRGNRAAVLVHRHRSRGGAFPASLRELASPTAFDPYAVRPFRYRRSGDDFVLYSVGEDGVDDGGTHIPSDRRNRNRGITGGDIVFWPLWKDCDSDE